MKRIEKAEKLLVSAKMYTHSKRWIFDVTCACVYILCELAVECVAYLRFKRGA